MSDAIVVDEGVSRAWSNRGVRTEIALCSTLGVKTNDGPLVFPATAVVLAFGASEQDNKAPPGSRGDGTGMAELRPRGPRRRVDLPLKGSRFNSTHCDT